MSSLDSTNVLTGSVQGSIMMRCDLQQDHPGRRGKGRLEAGRLRRTTKMVRRKII